MQVVVLNGYLSETEQDAYVNQVTEKYPPSMIEKIFLDVRDGFVDVQYELHRSLPLHKMGGYCIGVPESWNAAKRAELRDTVANRIDI